MSRFQFCTHAIRHIKGESNAHKLATACESEDDPEAGSTAQTSAQIIQITNLEQAIGRYKLAVEATCSCM